MIFGPEGHVHLVPTQFLKMAQEDPRALVNDYLLVGTPKIFSDYRSFCHFRRDLAERLGLPPQTIVIRGSAKLGYSIAPKTGKLWTGFTASSDIDVAIVDALYFTRLDDEIRKWEVRQRNPAPEIAFVERQRDRAYNCVRDYLFPRNTCVAHTDVMDAFDTGPYGVGKRKVSAFVFGDWWSLRNRYLYDLKCLCDAVRNGTVPRPT